jgi:hypothetical protein
LTCANKDEASSKVLTSYGRAGTARPPADPDGVLPTIATTCGERCAMGCNADVSM